MIHSLVRVPKIAGDYQIWSHRHRIQMHYGMVAFLLLYTGGLWNDYGFYV